VVDNWGKGLLVDLMSPTLAGQVLARRVTGYNERAAASPAMARAAYAARRAPGLSRRLARGLYRAAERGGDH